MSGAVAERTWTIEELEALDDADRFELVCGQLREREVSELSDAVGQRLLYELGKVVHERGLGLLNGPSVGVPSGLPEIRLPRPDGKFTRQDRLPGGRPSRGFAAVTPDLVFEVVSTHEDAAYLQKKVETYLVMGVPLVWVIYPDTRSVLVYRTDGSVTALREPQLLTGEDVIPGFSVALGTFMPEPELDTGSA